MSYISYLMPLSFCSYFPLKYVTILIIFMIMFSGMLSLMWKYHSTTYSLILASLCIKFYLNLLVIHYIKNKVLTPPLSLCGSRVPSFVVWVWCSKYVLFSDSSFYTVIWTFFCLCSTSAQCRNFLAGRFGWLILRVHMTHTAQPLRDFSTSAFAHVWSHQSPSVSSAVFVAAWGSQWAPACLCAFFVCIWAIVKPCKGLFISLGSSLKFL